MHLGMMGRADSSVHGGTAAAAARVALVVNPDSRACDPARCEARLRAFGAEVESFDIGEIDRAVAAGADRLVVAGGDGSVAPAASAAGQAGLPLALIPCGTANDFARRLGVPLGLSAACRLAVSGRRLRALELGWMEPVGGESGGGARRSPFVNTASVGLPAPAASAARTWKKPLGPLAYAAAAVVAGLTARPLPVTVSCEAHPLFEGDAWQVTVAASGAFGGGARIAEADPADGALDVVAVGAGPRPGLVGLAYRLRSGRLTTHRRAASARCGSVELRVPPGTDFNVDGELVPFGPAGFTAQPAAFRLVVA
jgi:diacylglycerol kinase (ATP)